MSRLHWLLAVLEDLRIFAAKNGMEHLELQLKLASWTASRELLDANIESKTSLEIEDAEETSESASETSEQA
ncbi:hypothetical protein [Antarcticimicrobium sediminis]|uniref:Uncharacterized protein n=1 Tax=Antarcticimicrobium sediminis TaxID=2546227 RepID=A0A4R5EXB1_9RHOB|nr:hypothetical protein [Antarcticimicrobium sediminis]TDE39614.1 hypothetical protein E1B25_06070 [Antarcticimicrobium sediminis]